MSYSEDVSAKTNVAVQCEIQLNEVDGDSTEVQTVTGILYFDFEVNS